MSYQKTSVLSILQYVNEANGTSFVEGELEFSAPQVVAGTWREGTTQRNTAVRVSGVAPKYQGRKVLTYDRLDLASLDRLPGFVVKGFEATSIHQLLANIRQYTGVNLTAADVEDSALVDDGNGNISGVLSAKPTSLGWIGSLAVNVTAGGIALDEEITNAELPGLNYPTASDQDVYGQMYLYGYDFTQIFNDLVDIEAAVVLTNQAYATVLRDYINTVDVGTGKGLWNLNDGQVTWSLYGATVISNGLNDHENLPTNPLYKYVMVLELAATVTTPKGRLYLHYNDPFDPNDF